MIASDLEAPVSGPAVGTNSPEPPSNTYLSEDMIFHLLQNERRRLALRYLREAEDAVEMRDVAEQVAAWENDTTVAALGSDQRQRVYIPLYQNHLPKLDDEGVIEYDQSRGVVERTPVADQLDPYLCTGDASDAAPATIQREDEDRWPLYYLVASLLGIAAITAVALGAPVVGTVSPLVVGALVVATFSLLSLGHVAGPLSTTDAR